MLCVQNADMLVVIHRQSCTMTSLLTYVTWLGIAANRHCVARQVRRHGAM